MIKKSKNTKKLSQTRKELNQKDKAHQELGWV